MKTIPAAHDGDTVRVDEGFVYLHGPGRDAVILEANYRDRRTVVYLDRDGVTALRDHLTAILGDAPEVMEVRNFGGQTVKTIPATPDPVVEVLKVVEAAFETAYMRATMLVEDPFFEALETVRAALEVRQ